MAQLFEFRCTSWGYKRQVSGGPDVGGSARTITARCSQCIELLDVVISTTPWKTGGGKPLRTVPCPRCGGQHLKRGVIPVRARNVETRVCVEAWRPSAGTERPPSGISSSVRDSLCEHLSRLDRAQPRSFWQRVNLTPIGIRDTLRQPGPVISLYSVGLKHFTGPSV